MKALAASLFICLLFGASTISYVPRRESCSCTADDGSCSASISCRAGCIAFCPSKGCRAMCAESGGVAEVNPPQKSSFLTNGEDRHKVAIEAAQRTDAETLFTLVRPQYAPKQKVQNNFLEDTDVRTLRRALMSSEKMSVCFRGVPASSLTDELYSLMGLNIKVEAGDASTIINYSGKDVTFSETLAQVSKQTGVRFSVKR